VVNGLRCAGDAGALNEKSDQIAFALLKLLPVHHGSVRGGKAMAASQPRPQVMRLTDAAAERIKAVMAKADRSVAALRVGVKNGGCAGMSYFMEYADKVDPLDEVIEDKGVRILVDPKAVLFLLGTEMDYKVDKLSAQFVFNNPNQTGACGCGESVQIEPAGAGADAEVR
jgi:iron-sulfur cluster assembly protein